MWYIEDAIYWYRNIIDTIKNNICDYYVEPWSFLHDHNCKTNYIRKCKNCNITKMEDEIKRLEHIYYKM